MFHHLKKRIRKNETNGNKVWHGKGFWIDRMKFFVQSDGLFGIQDHMDKSVKRMCNDNVFFYLIKGLPTKLFKTHLDKVTPSCLLYFVNGDSQIRSSRKFWGYLIKQKLAFNLPPFICRRSNYLRGSKWTKCSSHIWKHRELPRLVTTKN